MRCDDLCDDLCDELFDESCDENSGVALTDERLNVHEHECSHAHARLPPRAHGPHGASSFR